MGRFVCCFRRPIARAATPLWLRSFTSSWSMASIFFRQSSISMFSEPMRSDSYFGLDGGELLDCKFEFFGAVCGGYLYTNTSFALRHDGIGKTNYVDSSFEQHVGHV